MADIITDIDTMVVVVDIDMVEGAEGQGLGLALL